jgi:cytochrome P450
MASTRDEHIIGAMKRQIGGAFNMNAMYDYEHHIDLAMETFFNTLRKQGLTMDLMSPLSFFTFDAISRIAFSSSFDPDEDQKAVREIIVGGQQRFAHWHRWLALPKIEALLFKNRFAAGAGQSVLLGAVKQRLTGRLDKRSEGQYHDILDRLLQARDNDPDTFTDERIMGLTLSILHAGSETTSHLLSNVIWDLFRNPNCYSRLKSEVRSAGLSDPPKLAEVKALTYLEACIKESARLHSALQNPFEKIVPAGGAQVGSTWLPGGTVVGSYQIYPST